MARKRKCKSKSGGSESNENREVVFSSSCISSTRSSETGAWSSGDWNRPDEQPPIKLKIARLSLTARPRPSCPITVTTDPDRPSEDDDDQRDRSVATQESTQTAVPESSPAEERTTGPAVVSEGSVEYHVDEVADGPSVERRREGEGEEEEEVASPERCDHRVAAEDESLIVVDATGVSSLAGQHNGESCCYDDVGGGLGGVILSAEDVEGICRDSEACLVAGDVEQHSHEELDSEDEKDSDWVPSEVEESRRTRRSTRVATLKSKQQGQRPTTNRSRLRILTPQPIAKKRKPHFSDIRKAPALSTWANPSPPPSLPPPLSPISGEPLPRPITGVDKARPCGDCSQKHSPSDCQLHRPTMIVPDSPLSVCEEDQIGPMAETSLPDILKLVTIDQKHGPSVVAAGTIRQHTQFGPLVGLRIDEADIHEDMDLKNIWELFCENNVKLYLDTSDPDSSNWLRYLRPASTKSERNLSAITKEGNLFFVTVKDVAAGTELVYWAEDPTVSWSKKKIEKTSCGGCNQKFHHPIYYRMHCMIFHDPNYSLTIRKYHCKICGIAVLGKENIMRHASEMHDGKGAYQCQYCKKFFLRLNYLDMHRTYGCKLNPRRSRPLCDLCGKKFCQPQKLKVHIRRMHSDISEVLKEFQCKSCFKLLGSRAALQRHLKEVHHKDQNIAATCDRCGKTFQNKSNLKIHMLTHSGVKPFRCIESGCTAAFTTKQCLQFHYKKVHSYTGDNMPSIERCISYTFESYSGKGGAMSAASRAAHGDVPEDGEVVEEEDDEDEDEEMLMMDVAHEFRPNTFSQQHNHRTNNNHHNDTNSVPSVASTSDLESPSSSMCSSSLAEFPTGPVKPDAMAVVQQLGGCEDCCREEVDDIEAAMAMDRQRGCEELVTMATDTMEDADDPQLRASPDVHGRMVTASDNFQPLDMTPLPPVSILSPRPPPSASMLLPLLSVAPPSALSVHHLGGGIQGDISKHSPLDVRDLHEDCVEEDMVMDDGEPVSYRSPLPVAVKAEVDCPAEGVELCHRQLHPRDMMEETDDMDDIERVTLDHRGFAPGHDIDSSDVDLDTDLDDDVGCGASSAPCLELVHHRGEEDDKEEVDERHRMSPLLDPNGHHHHQQQQQQLQQHHANQRAMLEYQEQPSPYQENPSPYQERSSPYQERLSPYHDRTSPYLERSSPYQERSSPYQERSMHPIPTISAATYAAHLMGRMTAAKDGQGHLHKEFSSGDVMASLACDFAIVRHYVNSLTQGVAGDYGVPPHPRHHNCEDEVEDGMAGIDQDDLVASSTGGGHHHHHHHDNSQEQDELDGGQQQQQSMAEDLSSQFSRYELVDHRNQPSDSPPVKACKVECDDLVEPLSVTSASGDPNKSSHLDQRDDDPDDLLSVAAPDDDDDDNGASTVAGMSRDDLSEMTLLQQQQQQQHHHHQQQVQQEQEMHLMSQFVRHVLPPRELDRLPLHSLDLSLPRTTLHLLEHLARTTNNVDHVVLRSPPSPSDDPSPSSHLSQMPAFHHGMDATSLPRPLPHRLEQHHQQHLDHLSTSSVSSHHHHHHSLEHLQPRSPPSPSPQQLDLDSHLSPRMDAMSPPLPSHSLDHLGRPPSHGLDSYVVDHHHLSRLPPSSSHGMDAFLLGRSTSHHGATGNSNHCMEFLTRPSPRSSGNHRLEALARSFAYPPMEHPGGPPAIATQPPPSSSSSSSSYLLATPEHLTRPPSHHAPPSSPSLYQTTPDPRSTPVSSLSLDLTTPRGGGGGMDGSSPQSSSPPPLPTSTTSAYQECSPATPSSSSSSYQAAVTPTPTTSQLSLSPAPPPPPPPASVHPSYPTYLEYY